MLSKYQKFIINEVNNGAVIDCSEGKNYKAWLKYKDGKIKYIRKDSVSIILKTFDRFVDYNNENELKFTKNILV